MPSICNGRKQWCLEMSYSATGMDSSMILAKSTNTVRIFHFMLLFQCVMVMMVLNVGF